MRLIRSVARFMGVERHGRRSTWQVSTYPTYY